MTPSENRSERGEPPSPRKYSGAVYCAVPRMSSWSVGRRRLDDAGDLRRAKIDDLRRSGLVDHDVVRPDVLMQHLHPVKGAQSLGDLLDDIRGRFPDPALDCRSSIGSSVCPSMNSMTT